MEKYLKEYDQLFRTTQKLTEELESQMYTNETMENEHNARRRDIARTHSQVSIRGASTGRLWRCFFVKAGILGNPQL